MSANDEKFAAVKVWLDNGLMAAAVDPDDSRAVLLADYLQSDVQASEKGARLYLGWLDAVLSGDLESEGGTGNAFTVTIECKSVLLENEYMKQLKEFRYSHGEYRMALEQVLALVLGAQRKSYSDQE